MKEAVTQEAVFGEAEAVLVEEAEASEVEEVEA